MIYILIAIIIVLAIKYNDLKIELESLKKANNRLNNDNNYCPHCGYDLRTNKELSTTERAININQSTPVTASKVKPKIEMSEKEIKNSTILVTGAVLILIAAIVFLTSTWNTTLDIVKTIIVFLMFLVFLGSSFIADKYLHIKQTSKVFLYLALSYLPLVFLSVSLFHLLGDYLSINGEGKYIYLFISSCTLSIIYYYIMKKKKDLFFSIGSILFQILSIILLSLSFTSNITLVFILLSLYILALHYLYDKKNYYFSPLTHNRINTSLTIGTAVASLFFFTEYNLSISLDFSLIVYLITMYFNHYYLLVKEKENQEVFSYSGPIHILLTMLFSAYVLNGDFVTYQLLLITGIIISYFIDYSFNNNRITLGNYITSSIFYILMYIISISFENAIPSYILMLLYGLLVLLTVKYIDKYNMELSNIVFIPFYIFIVDLVLSLKLNVAIISIISLLVLVISNSFKNDNTQLVKSLRTTSFAFTIIGYLLNAMNTVHGYTVIIILSIIYVAVYYSLFIFNKKNIYQITSYTFVITSFFFISLSRQDIELYSYIVPASSLIVFLLELLVSNPSSKKYLKTLLIIGLISLIIPSNSLLTIVFYLVLTILFVLFVYDNKESENLLYIPLLSYSFYCLNNNYIVLGVPVQLLLSVLLILYLLSSFVLTKKTIYIPLSLIHVFVVLMTNNFNKYINILLLIICFSIYYYFVNQEKHKDIFKAGLYILITILIRFIIKDVNLESITLLRVGIYVISFILLSRNIIKKYSSTDYKIAEYVVLSILYLFAIGVYETELNGMLFVFLLLVLSIFGYLKRWGPIFLVSLVFIIINTFILTRLFWLSLPWWVYLLLVGSILIAFAVNNELHEKENYKNKLKDMADKIDL